MLRSPCPAIPPIATSCRRWASMWSRSAIRARGARPPPDGGKAACHPCAKAAQGRTLCQPPPIPPEPPSPPTIWRELVEAARESGIAVISDEIYHRLNYVSPDVSALSFDEDVVVINSFSKYYCMTGWRIGWMVLPHWLVRQVERLQQSL